MILVIATKLCFYLSIFWIPLAISSNLASSLSTFLIHWGLARILSSLCHTLQWFTNIGILARSPFHTVQHKPFKCFVFILLSTEEFPLADISISYHPLLYNFSSNQDWWNHMYTHIEELIDFVLKFEAITFRCDAKQHSSVTIRWVNSKTRLGRFFKIRPFVEKV